MDLAGKRKYEGKLTKKEPNWEILHKLERNTAIPLKQERVMLVENSQYEAVQAVEKEEEEAEKKEVEEDLGGLSLFD
jgi:hypothetical protein